MIFLASLRACEMERGSQTPFDLPLHRMYLPTTTPPRFLCLRPPLREEPQGWRLKATCHENSARPFWECHQGVEEEPQEAGGTPDPRPRSPVPHVSPVPPAALPICRGRRVPAPKDVHAPILRTCGRGARHSKGGFAGGVSMRTSRRGPRLGCPEPSGILRALKNRGGKQKTMPET